MNLTTKELPLSEQPYEKCKQKGPCSLTDSELLSVFLRSGTRGINSIDLSKNILKAAGDVGLVGLNSLSFRELMNVKGVGEVKAIQIMCIAEMSKRISKGNLKDLPEFSNADTVAHYFMEDMRHLDKEHLIMAMLDTRNHLIGSSTVSVGTVNASFLSSREILIEALQKKAVRIILVHNHPSGDPTPSREDIDGTRRIASAAGLVGLELLDHIIIGDNQYISLKNKRII